MNAKIKQFANETNRVFNKAVKKAQQQNRDKGIHNVYCRDGKIYYETTSGTNSKQARRKIS